MKDINKLLEKYWEGETTIEEEKIIKQHFASQKSTDENSKALFSFFENEKQIKYTGDITITGKAKKEIKVIRMSFLKKIAVAASVLLIFGLGYLTMHNLETQNQFAKNEIKDKEKARMIAEDALAMLAYNFNKGETAVSKNMKNLDKINIINSIIK